LLLPISAAHHAACLAGQVTSTTVGGVPGPLERDDLRVGDLPDQVVSISARWGRAVRLGRREGVRRPGQLLRAAGLGL
jgi:hypothetical protein